jgi:hypothetical protein
MFGRKGERLTADEQEQIGQLALDLEEHALRPAVAYSCVTGH